MFLKYSQQRVKNTNIWRERTYIYEELLLRDEIENLFRITYEIPANLFFFFRFWSHVTQHCFCLSGLLSRGSSFPQLRGQCQGCVKKNWHRCDGMRVNIYNVDQMAMRRKTIWRIVMATSEITSIQLFWSHQNAMEGRGCCFACECK